TWRSSTSRRSRSPAISTWAADLTAWRGPRSPDGPASPRGQRTLAHVTEARRGDPREQDERGGAEPSRDPDRAARARRARRVRRLHVIQLVYGLLVVPSLRDDEDRRIAGNQAVGEVRGVPALVVVLEPEPPRTASGRPLRFELDPNVSASLS